MMPLDDLSIAVKLLRDVKLRREILRMDDSVATGRVISIRIHQINRQDITRRIVLPTTATTIRKRDRICRRRNITPISA